MAAASGNKVPPPGARAEQRPGVAALPAVQSAQVRVQSATAAGEHGWREPLPLRSSPHLMFLTFQVGDLAVRYHSCEKGGSSLGGGGAPGSSCCQSVHLPESGRSVCEVCLISSRPVATGSSACSTLPLPVQSHLRRCCLHTDFAPARGCSDFRRSYSPFSRYSACCRRASPPHSESEAKEVPDGHRTAPAPSTSTGDDITGLRCQTNRTLRFYVLDVALNWPLAVRLGATEGRRNASLSHQGGDSGDRGDSPFAAIVDLKDEVHYVLHRSPLSTLTESLGKNTYRHLLDPKANLELILSPPLRGLHQELQRSVQPSAEASGGGRRRERWGWGQQTSGRAPAFTTTASHHRAHHLILPLTRHGRAKGAETLGSRGRQSCVKPSERVSSSRTFCSSTTLSGVASARLSTTSSSNWPDYCRETAPSLWPGSCSHSFI